MSPTFEDFTRQLVSSGLLAENELGQWVERLQGEGRPATAEELRNLLVREGRLTRFQAACVWEGKTQWLRFGEYEVLDRIGHGGMGMVLKARHRRMDRVVAIKTLRPQMMREPGAVERFYREVKAAARLNHPNIVTAYDAGEHQGIHYLVMEYVEGEDLGRLVTEHGPLPVQEAVECVLQAARGLAYAHQQGVIHRDIKPGNLLLDRCGAVKILDMGLARVLLPGGETAPGDQLTGTGQVMGTCDYMAPEQAVSTHRVDGRADIYSLGCTLYRLLTGEAPYKGETLVEVLLAHREAPIPSLREKRPEVTEELEGVFRRMVAKRPEERYQTMEEVIRALEGCLVKVAVGGGRPEVVEASESTVSALRAWLEGRSAEKETGPAGGAEVATLAVGVGKPVWGKKGIEGKREGLGKWLAAFQGVVGVVPEWLWGVGAVGLILVVGILGLVILRNQPSASQGRLASGDGRRGKVTVRGSLKVREEGGDGKGRVSTKGETESAAESGGLEESLGRVLITWPEAERSGGVLRVDGAELGYEEFVDAGNRDLLRLVLIPGEHVVRLERQGFEAWEERVKVEASQEVALHPQWRAINAPQAGQAEQMLAEGEKPTETAAPVEKPPVEPPVAVTSVRLGLDLAWEKLEGLLREWEAREAEFTQKVAPIEELVKRWQFQEATEAAKGVSFTDPSLAERWRVRQEELVWLAEWKGRILEKINAGGGRLRKADLGLRGLGGEVVAADEQKLTCRLLGGKTEELPWEDLGSQAEPFAL